MHFEASDNVAKLFNCDLISTITYMPICVVKRYISRVTNTATMASTGASTLLKMNHQQICSREKKGWHAGQNKEEIEESFANTFLTAE